MVGYHWNTIKRFCGSPTVFILINIYNLCLVTSICTPFNHLTLQTFITESLFEWKEIHFTCTVLQCVLVIGYHRKKIGHFVIHDFLSYLVQVQFEMCQWYLWVFYIQNIIQWFHTCPLFRNTIAASYGCHESTAASCGLSMISLPASCGSPTNFNQYPLVTSGNVLLHHI